MDNGREAAGEVGKVSDVVGRSQEITCVLKVVHIGSLRIILGGGDGTRGASVGMARYGWLYHHCWSFHCFFDPRLEPGGTVPNFGRCDVFYKKKPYKAF